MTTVIPEPPAPGPVYEAPDTDTDPTELDLLVDLAGSVLSGDHYQAFVAKAGKIQAGAKSSGRHAKSADADTADTADADDEQPPPYDAWTKAELADEAAGRGLPTSGTKDELAARLAADDASA